MKDDSLEAALFRKNYNRVLVLAALRLKRLLALKAFLVREKLGHVFLIRAEKFLTPILHEAKSFIPSCKLYGSG